MNHALRQTLAIFHDTYRDLNSKRLFWIVLVLSGVVVLAFAAIGFDGGRITLFGFRTPFPTPPDKAEFYKDSLFDTWGIGVWLTWAAMILALVSTAGLIPEFVAGGSVDLFLCKPISRLRLFLTKYVAGLLFVALQVGVFSAASYLVLGLRASLWDARIFLAVPVVVAVFSYIFCVQVLLGIWTRSTTASLLLSLLFWLLIFVVSFAETQILQGVYTVNHMAAAYDARAARVEAAGKRAATTRAFGFFGAFGKGNSDSRSPEELRAAATDLRNSVGKLRAVHRAAYWLKSVLPKTGETEMVLERSLLGIKAMDAREQRRLADKELQLASLGFGDSMELRAQEQAKVQMRQDVHRRSVRWIMGSSLCFEAFVLLLAAWSFARRDY